MDRVLNTSDDVKGKFEDKYSKELSLVKDNHLHDLERQKSNMKDIYQTQIDFLTQNRDDQERRVSRLEMELKDKAKSYDELLYEFRKLQKSGDEELGHLKLAVRARSDDLARVQHLYEDNMILVKELKMENEVLKQKIDVLKQEYYKVETAARAQNCDIRAELAVCKERLANYDLIEKELDQAIMNVASGSGDTASGDYDNTIGNALIQTITSAPTTAKRRIQ